MLSASRRGRMCGGVVVVVVVVVVVGVVVPVCLPSKLRIVKVNATP
jgi:hypothetical protein